MCKNQYIHKHRINLHKKLLLNKRDFAFYNLQINTIVVKYNKQVLK